MENLLALAAAEFEQVEVYSLAGHGETVEFRDHQLKDVHSSRSSGVSLRVVDSGRLGFAYTRSLRDPTALMTNARASLTAGAESPITLPKTEPRPELPIFDAACEKITASDLLEECRRVDGILGDETSGEAQVTGWAWSSRLRLINSRGTDLSKAHTDTGLAANVAFPGTAAGIARLFRTRLFTETPARMIDEIVLLYRAGQRIVTPAGGRMQVLFMPGSLHPLIHRLRTGTNAQSVHEGISPVADRVGEKVLSEKITLLNDPLDPAHHDARTFDDEGVPCRRFALYEKGVLGGFFTDLLHAVRLGIEPTGHGFRHKMWSSDPVAVKPIPAADHLKIAPGGSTFDELVARMDRGIVLEAGMGGHSGNIPNGDYSVGVCPALYVEKGEIAGRVKDAMVSGNVYETFNEVVAVGDRLEPAGLGLMPAVLCDGVSVAMK